MENLPVDILKHTTGFLSLFDRVNLRLISKKLRTQVSSLTNAKKSTSYSGVVSHHYHDVNHSSPCSHGYNAEINECNMEPATICYEDFNQAFSLTLNNEGALTFTIPMTPVGAAITSSSRIDFADASGLFNNLPMAVSHFDQPSITNLPNGVNDDIMMISATARDREMSPLSPRIDFTDASELFTDHPMTVSYFQSCIDMGGMSFDEEDSVPPIIYVFEED